MGYESKVIVVRRSELIAPSGAKLVFGEEIARFDLGKMCYEYVGNKTFPDLFTKPIDFNLYNLNENDDPNVAYDDEHYRTDCYGDHCCSTKIATVLSWLEKSEAIQEYWKAQVLYDFLLALLARGHKELLLVHYGY